MANREQPEALDRDEMNGSRACSDISLWEIAMLVGKGRLDPGTDSATFSRLALEARGIRLLPITPEIALESVRVELPQGDPADRLIAATAMAHGAILLASDQRLREYEGLKTRW